MISFYAISCSTCLEIFVDETQLARYFALCNTTARRKTHFDFSQQLRNNCATIEQVVWVLRIVAQFDLQISVSCYAFSRQLSSSRLAIETVVRQYKKLYSILLNLVMSMWHISLAWSRARGNWPAFVRRGNFFLSGSSVQRVLFVCKDQFPSCYKPQRNHWSRRLNR